MVLIIVTLVAHSRQVFTRNRQKLTLYWRKPNISMQMTDNRWTGRSRTSTAGSLPLRPTRHSHSWGTCHIWRLGGSCTRGTHFRPRYNGPVGCQQWFVNPGPPKSINKGQRIVSIKVSRQQEKLGHVSLVATISHRNGHGSQVTLNWQDNICESAARNESSTVTHNNSWITWARCCDAKAAEFK